MPIRLHSRCLFDSVLQYVYVYVYLRVCVRALLSTMHGCR